MNKILITGATGFIGTYLTKFLLDEFQIRALVRLPEKTNLFSKKIDIVTGDLVNEKSLIHICENIDTVFHLGGYAHAFEENNDSFTKQHYLVNFYGTKNILEEAIRAKVKKFIFFSTVKAVDDSNQFIDESWDKNSKSPYGISKREAEKLVLAAKNLGMHVCILRPALVYGPGWKGNLANMLRAIDHGFFPPLPETNNCRSMISVEDICRAALLAANHPKANGKIYFVTDGIPYSARQIYIAMLEALGKRSYSWSLPLWLFKLLAITGDIGTKITRRRLPFNSEAMSKLFGFAHYNSERIQNELGFKPIYNLRKMLPMIIKQYRLS